MKIFITIFFMISALFVSAQENTILTDSKKITGVITDNEGMPIPGVRVIVEGKGEGIMTDFDGNYTIYANVGEKLVVSYIGMFDETITINEQNNIDFKLKKATFVIKPILTSEPHAIKSVTAIWEESKLRKEFIMLQEKKPAISIGCTPDLSETIIIRCSGSINGNHEPLYVINGYLLNADNFKAVNPADIISINVLKDAEATSIYGYRGENGVIIVKTKNGLTNKEKRKQKLEAKRLAREQIKKS